MQNENNIPDSLIQKLQKLLRLGNSDNPNESDLAMQKAQKLATEYNVDLAAIQLYDKSKSVEKIERSDIDLEAARKSVTQHGVTRILTDYFNVKVLYSGGRYNGVKLILIGTKTDIEFATYLNGYLNNEFMRRWQNFKKKTSARTQERNSFIYGLERGLAEKLESSKKQAEAEKFASYGIDASAVENQYALMVVNHKERLEQALGEMFPHLRKATSRSFRYFGDAFSSGKAEGKTINTNRAIGSRAMIEA
jgi:pyruvate/2-oxoglutarate dehydrogenase complex dihydrolipoamide acyltransferase (E2) component